MISGRTTPLEQAISEGSVSVDADFLSNAHRQRLLLTCAQSTLRSGDAAQPIGRWCCATVISTSSLSIPTGTRALETRNCCCSAAVGLNELDNRRHLEQITEPLGNGAGPWRCVRIARSVVRKTGHRLL